MYVALSGPKGHESVQIREDYVPDGGGKKKTRIIRQVGPLHRLLEGNPDALEELKAQVREETREKRHGRTMTITVSTRDVNEASDGYRHLRFGHAVFKRLWEMMGLDRFCERQFGDRRNAESFKEAVYYMAMRRISHPSSIAQSCRDIDTYAGVGDIADDVLYAVLDAMCEKKEALLEHLSSFFGKHTERRLDHVCYDVTNFYFESTKEGELRLFGFSKEHRNEVVIVVMGLLIDGNGIPITFQMFEGNRMDQNTLADAVEGLKERYGLGEVTVVADRGMNSNENLVFLSDEGHHFVVSYTLKKASGDLRARCLEGGWDKEAYDPVTGELMSASKVLDTTAKARVLLSDEELNAIREQRKAEHRRGRCPRYREVEVPAKLHVTYDMKRAHKDAADRQRAVEKLERRVSESKVTASLRHGCNRYLNSEVTDGKGAYIDRARIDADAAWDGYYAIVTDRQDLSTEDVSRMYRDQWRIEESFRILKSDLESRPVRVWTDPHILGHFTLCYLDLCVIRYLQYLMTSRGMECMSADRIMDAIDEPKAVILGEKDKASLGVSVTDDYLAIASLLGMPLLQKTMSVTTFRARLKLDPVSDIRKLVG